LVYTYISVQAHVAIYEHIQMEEKIRTHSHSVAFVTAPPLLAAHILQIAEVTLRSLQAFQKLFG